jgi:DNA-binding IclR family transcriptional regulator
MNTSKQSIEQAVFEALAARPEMTAAEVAALTARGRSTVGKALAKLEHDGKVRRNVGGRHGSRRLPNSWILAASDDEALRGRGYARRLRPGQLDGLVLEYLRAHRADGPLGPAVVAKGLGRSSGAVGNCLVRLVRAKKVRQVKGRFRRYRVI